MRNKDKKANSFLALTISFIVIVTVSSALYKDLAEMDFPFLYQVFEILDQECLSSDNDSFNKLGFTFFSPPLSQATSSLAEKPSYSFFETPSPNQQTLVLRC
jgi:hypothetical protein